MSMEVLHNEHNLDKLELFQIIKVSINYIPTYKNKLVVRFINTCLYVSTPGEVFLVFAFYFSRNLGFTKTIQ